MVLKVSEYDKILMTFNYQCHIHVVNESTEIDIRIDRIVTKERVNQNLFL